MRSVGQIELIFSIIASALFFREKTRLIEVLGMALFALSIIFIVALA